MNSPLFILIISTYKQSEKELPRLIESLDKQTYKNWYAFVVHDGPDKDTRELITKSHKKTWRYFYFETEKRENIWGHNSRSLGLDRTMRLDRYGEKYCTADYIYFINGDNELFPDALETFAKLYVDYTVESANAGSPTDFYIPDILLANIKHSYFNYTVLPVEFAEARCDFLNMVISSDILKDSGFPWRKFAADAQMINHIKATYDNKLKIAKSNKVIGIHH